MNFGLHQEEEEDNRHDETKGESRKSFNQRKKNRNVSE
jgi:hypothetical protein